MLCPTQMKSAVGFILLIYAATCVGAAERTEPLTGNLISEYGCTLDYEYYRPHPQEEERTVILAHGFMRSLKSMRGWASFWQPQGIGTVIVSFCNSSIFNGHHQRNADDMTALREHLELENVVYAGFSAGGLAAYLAALKDESASAYLGLDSVDSGNLAETANTALEVPSFFLVAAPSACNAQNNMLETIFKHSYPMSHIDGATHCHFESPYDARCSWLCGKSSAEQTATIQAVIFRQATDWLRSSPAFSD